MYVVVASDTAADVRLLVLEEESARADREEWRREWTGGDDETGLSKGTGPALTARMAALSSNQAGISSVEIQRL